jgi:DNA-binding MarR family transcriptional regulator
LQNRELVVRLPHPIDGRVMGLHLTQVGVKLMQDAEQTAFDLEKDATPRLTATERKTLIKLLQKIYT